MAGPVATMTEWGEQGSSPFLTSRNGGDLGEMAFGLLLFKGRHEFIFGRKNSTQVSDSIVQTKMTPAIAALQDDSENIFRRAPDGSHGRYDATILGEASGMISRCLPLRGSA